MNITATLLIQVLAFALLIFFINRVLWKPLTKAMAERQERIESGLMAAEKGQQAQAQAEQKVAAVLSESKAQAQDIVTQAQKQAGVIVEQAKAQAKLEADKIKTQAQAELSQDVVKAKNELKTQVSDLVIKGVQAVLEKEVDKNAHQTLVNKLANSL